MNNSINGTYFERIYHSRNLALIVDAIAGAPGNIYFLYITKQDKELNVSFIDGFLRVMDSDDPDTAIKFHFFLDSTTKINETNVPIKPTPSSSSPGSPKLLKEENYLDAYDEEEIKPHLYKLKCPKVDTYKELINVQFLVDPGHGGVDIGAEDGGIEEKAVVLGVSNTILDPFGNFDGIEKTRDIDLDVPINTRVTMANDPINDIFISLHVMNLTEMKEVPAEPYNFIKAYVSPKYNLESRKLACLIINNILERSNICGVDKDLPCYDGAYIVIEDDLPLLSVDKPGIYLEIANIRSPNVAKVLDYPFIVGNSIYDGVVAYFNETSCLAGDGCNLGCEKGDPDCACDVQSSIDNPWSICTVSSKCIPSGSGKYSSDAGICCAGGCCGNGEIDAGFEDCDSDNHDGKTCVDFDFTGGTLRCTDYCRFNTTDCT